MRVSQVFLNTCMRVSGGIGSGVCFCLFMVSACYWRGRLCFGRGRDRGFVLYISLFVGGLEVGFVSACSWLALVTGVGGYVLAGVEIRVLSYIFLYLCGC